MGSGTQVGTWRWEDCAYALRPWTSAREKDRRQHGRRIADVGTGEESRTSARGKDRGRQPEGNTEASCHCRGTAAAVCSSTLQSYCRVRRTTEAARGSRDGPSSRATAGAVTHSQSGTSRPTSQKSAPPSRCVIASARCGMLVWHPGVLARSERGPPMLGRHEPGSTPALGVLARGAQGRDSTGFGVGMLPLCAETVHVLRQQPVLAA